MQVHVKSILTDGSNNHEKEEWDCPGGAVLKALSDADPMPLRVESLLEDVRHTLGGLVMDSLDCCLPLFKELGTDVPEPLRQGEMDPHAGSCHSSLSSITTADHSKRSVSSDLWWTEGAGLKGFEIA